MQYTINELRQEIFRNVYDVYEIFQNFFGEQFVDLQGVPDGEELSSVLSNHNILHHFDENIDDDRWEVNGRKLTAIKNTYEACRFVIMVWWPTVTVTNENDRSVQIQDLYAKITLNTEGTIPYEQRGFKLNRTTFSEIQYTSGYLHSHIPHFSGIPEFSNPCLGTGPINNTIMDLKNSSEEALWMLFCQELALYVTVESLRGGPYFRMEHIGSEKVLLDYTDYSSNHRMLSSLSNFWGYRDEQDKLRFTEMLKEFSLYYLQHGHLALNYKDGVFTHGMPFFDYVIDISNSFIDYFNEGNRRYVKEDLFERGILIKALAANGKFYENRNSIDHHDYSVYEGHDMFLFKGEMKHLHIEREAEVHTEVSTLLNHKIAMFILHNVLRIINYRYRNEYNKQFGSSATVAPTYQTVIYL